MIDSDVPCWFYVLAFTDFYKNYTTLFIVLLLCCKTAVCVWAVRQLLNLRFSCLFEDSNMMMLNRLHLPQIGFQGSNPARVIGVLLVFFFLIDS